jgi:NB-ARC domain
MQLARIDKEFVEACLRSFRQAARPNLDILDLCLLGRQGEDSPEARLLCLQDLINQLVRDAYLECRQAELLSTDIPENHKNIISTLKEDFHCNNSDLESWSAIYYRYLAIIPLSVEELSDAANVVPQQFRRRINQGLSYLAQKLRRLEMEAEEARRQTNPSLPLPDFARLVGAEPYLERLSSLFDDEDGPRLVSLEGMGGIGKTALARAFVALPEVSFRWKHILWVSARQYILAEDGHLTSTTESASTLDDVTARLVDLLGMAHVSSKPITERMETIQAALTMDAYLIVVDNLETMEEYQQLIPALAQCAGKSRFLITSRQTLRQFPYVQSIPLFELDFNAACELLRAEGKRQGFARVLSQDACAELYELVGGVPLAIKLVAAQLHLRTLDTILNGFRQAKGSIDDLYRYLYWQTWQLLGDPARHLLLAFLPADPEGEDVDFLQMMSGQTEEIFFEALREMDQFSLLETTGDMHTLRYRLHRLTVTFLQTDILSSWDENK